MNAFVGAIRDFGKLNNLPVVTNFIGFHDKSSTAKKIFEKQGFVETGFIMTHGIKD
jgi:hypothetical protein